MVHILIPFGSRSNSELNERMPMDQTFTTSSYLSENIIRTAVKRGSYGHPAQQTLDFIRNFAAQMSIAG